MSTKLVRDKTSNAAMEGVKDFILTHGLQPGDPVPTEGELVDRLGVSRSSVREAIRTLAALDIVEVRHGIGTFVGKLSMRPLVDGLVFRGVLAPGDNLRALRDVLEVRTALDLSVGERLAEAMKGTTNPDLSELVDRMTQKASAGESFTDEDREFHTRLLGRLDNMLFPQLVGAFWDVHTAVAPKLNVPTPDDIIDTVNAHGDILKALEDGDTAAYSAAVIRHYEPLKRVLSRQG